MPRGFRELQLMAQRYKVTPLLAHIAFQRITDLASLQAPECGPRRGRRTQSLNSLEWSGADGLLYNGSSSRHRRSHTSEPRSSRAQLPSPLPYPSLPSVQRWRVVSLYQEDLKAAMPVLQRLQCLGAKGPRDEVSSPLMMMVMMMMMMTMSFF